MLCTWFFIWFYKNEKCSCIADAGIVLRSVRLLHILVHSIRGAVWSVRSSHIIWYNEVWWPVPFLITYAFKIILETFWYSVLWGCVDIRIIVVTKNNPDPAEEWTKTIVLAGKCTKCHATISLFNLKQLEHEAKIWPTNGQHIANIWPTNGRKMCSCCLTAVQWAQDYLFMSIYWQS